MATKSKLHRARLPGWHPADGLAVYDIEYRLRFVKERYRRLLALLFAVLITFIIGVVIVSMEPIDTAVQSAVVGTVSIIGMTLIALIFGIEINDVSITRQGATLNFGDSEDGDD